jgi:hypothetical protein
VRKAYILDDTEVLDKVIITEDFAEIYFNSYEKHKLSPVELRKLIDDLITVAGKLPVPKPTDPPTDGTLEEPINMDNIPF